MPGIVNTPFRSHIITESNHLKDKKGRPTFRRVAFFDIRCGTIQMKRLGDTKLILILYHFGRKFTNYNLLSEEADKFSSEF